MGVGRVFSLLVPAPPRASVTELVTERRTDMSWACSVCGQSFDDAEEPAVSEEETGPTCEDCYEGVFEIAEEVFYRAMAE
jgi:hypothetical protein